MRELIRNAMERRWQERQFQKRLKRQKAHSKKTNLSVTERPVAQKKRVSPKPIPIPEKYAQVRMDKILNESTNEEQEEWSRLSKIFG